jgi:hypothetical protein
VEAKSDMFVRLVTTPAVNRMTWMPPVGLAQLAASLRSRNVNVHCLDLNPESKCGEVWIRTWELAVQPELKGAESFRKRHSQEVKKWAEHTLRESPDLVGLSILYHGMLIPSIALAMELHDLNPETRIVLGGPFVLPSNRELICHLLAHPAIAGIIEGEGEEAILDLVHALEEGEPLWKVPGMWTARNGEISFTQRNPQLDPSELPIADFSDFDLSFYRSSWHGSFPIFGSRGCVNRCTFCNSRKHTPHFRQRSISHLMEEINRDVSQYGIGRIAFTDNLINGNPREFKMLCRALIEANLGIKVFGSLALLPTVDDETLDLMKDAGFTDTLLAVESPSPDVRRDMGKWPNLEGVLRIVRGSVDRGMNPCIYLMHSFPTEKESDFEQLLHFVDEFDPSKILAVGTWPFRLAQVQPGEIDMEFVQRFNIELLGGYGLDQVDARVAFGREPRWKTKWVTDEIKKERHARMMKHLQSWDPRLKLPLIVRAGMFAGRVWDRLSRSRA